MANEIQNSEKLAKNYDEREEYTENTEHDSPAHEPPKTPTMEDISDDIDDSFFSEPIPKAHSTLVEQQLDIQPNPRTTKIRKTPPQGRIKCKECDKKYGRYYLKIHMRLHTGEKLITCNCHKKTFPSKGLYKQYHKYHSEHACPTCQKVFTTRIELNFHRRDHFPKPPRFNCSICGKGFLKIVNYKRHSHTHDSTMLMACKLCSKTFSETDDLIAHYEQHEKNIKHKISELKKV